MPAIPHSNPHRHSPYTAYTTKSPALPRGLWTISFTRTNTCFRSEMGYRETMASVESGNGASGLTCYAPALDNHIPQAGARGRACCRSCNGPQRENMAAYSQVPTSVPRSPDTMSLIRVAHIHSVDVVQFESPEQKKYVCDARGHSVPEADRSYHMEDRLK